MRKVMLAGALLAMLSLAGGTAVASDPLVLPGGEEGCVSPPGDTCTYTATRSGGIAANGSTWTLTVQIPANGDPRDTNLDGKLRYVFNSSNAPQEGCGLWSAGATVTTSGGAQGGIAAGNPFPGASDDVVGSNNDCDAGMIAANNPNYTPVD
jgi:hypothetical protein